MSVRLFVDNLPPATREEDLDQMFSMYGRVETIYLAGEWEASQKALFAFVDMEKQRAAEEAVAGLDQSLLGGRKIKVQISRSELKLAS
jgi:peptidyl-prolyl cis-trans isomerase-like 4